MLAWSSSCRSNAAGISPYLKRTRPCISISTSGDVVAAEMEDVVDLVVDGEEALCLSRRLEALHLALSPSRGLAWALGPIVQALMVPVLSGSAPSACLPAGVERV
jgi:hypothetical protein